MNAKPPRPTVLAPILENIPAEFKELPQWVFWRFELRQDKKGVWNWTKVPFGAGSDTTPCKAKANDPRTWLPFPTAVSLYRQHKFDGVGFEFAAAGPYFGIDLDKCRNAATSAIDSLALQIIDRFKTYAEISPSNTGVKLIGKGRLNLPAKANGKDRTGRRKAFAWSNGTAGQIEVYDRGRFFAMTGNLLAEVLA